MDVCASTTDVPDEQTRQAFDRLKDRFILNLPARWADIEAASGTGELLAGLHRLTGAAGSFGFDGLGSMARRAEAAASSSDAKVLTVALKDLVAEIDLLLYGGP